ncbi:MAG: RNA polymerase sigma factor, partial [Muribaculaceae bacterium]|nr:RNA polymerase sigma factor [Muribaculaceae bacterium]
MKLLALCMAADNREAFSRLVVAYQSPLRRFILNLTGGNAALTDDLAQDTFLKAWLGIRSFKGISGFKNRHYRIAIN